METIKKSLEKTYKNQPRAKKFTKPWGASDCGNSLHARKESLTKRESHQFLENEVEWGDRHYN